jgi:hypothetical protein
MRFRTHRYVAAPLNPIAVLWLVSISQKQYSKYFLSVYDASFEAPYLEFLGS